MTAPVIPSEAPSHVVAGSCSQEDVAGLDKTDHDKEDKLCGAAISEQYYYQAVSKILQLSSLHGLAFPYQLYACSV
jgi:hypothetical protein